MNSSVSGNFITAKQYALNHGVSYQTVIKWLQSELIAGVIKKTLEPPFTGHIYLIPENAKPPELKRGPKPKTK